MFLVIAALLIAGEVYHPLDNCRALDTRPSPGNPTGATLAAQETREVRLHEVCNVPTSALSVFVNVTVIPRRAPFGFLTIYKADIARPVVSLMNSIDGGLKSNAAIVGLPRYAPRETIAGKLITHGGEAKIYVTEEADVLIDVYGYFEGTDTLDFQQFDIATLPKPEGGSKLTISPATILLELEALRARIARLESDIAKLPR